MRRINKRIECKCDMCGASFRAGRRDAMYCPECKKYYQGAAGISDTEAVRETQRLLIKCAAMINGGVWPSQGNFRSLRRQRPTERMKA